MTAVWYDEDCDQIIISDLPQTFAPRSLIAQLDDDMIGIRLKSRPEWLVRCPWDSIAAHDGRLLTGGSATKAYLDGEFTKRRPDGGSTHVVPVAIEALGQTTIPLQQPPTLLSTACLEVNGITYRAPEIGASAVAITWQNPAFSLDPTDRVTAVYS